MADGIRSLTVLCLLMFLVVSLSVVQAGKWRAPEMLEGAIEVESHQIPTTEVTLTLMADVPIATLEAKERFEATKAAENEETLTLGSKGPLSLPLAHRDIYHDLRHFTSPSEYWTEVFRRDEARVAFISSSLDFQPRDVCPNLREALEFTGIPMPAACIKNEEIEKADADVDNFLLSHS